jgi:hypothetical protein
MCDSSSTTTWLARILDANIPKAQSRTVVMEQSAEIALSTLFLGLRPLNYLR